MIKGLTAILAGLGGILIVFWLIRAIGSEVEDFRILTINDSGIVLRSVSWQRMMINELKVAPEVEIWIPRGMGWYQSGKIKKLLFQQKKQDLAGDMAFYNFGFIPDVVIYSDSQDWVFDREIISKWGVNNFMRYFINRSKLMIKEEVVNSDLADATDILNNLVQRDLADSRLLKEDLRLTVYNQGQSDGLAGFMSRILEWSGFTVVGIENSGGDVDTCLVNYGSKADNTYGFEIVKKEFPECKYVEDKGIGEVEVELFFGDKFSQMLNYQSYVRTF